MNFLTEFLLRLKTESPSFFKKLQWIAGILTALATAAKVLIDNEVISPEHATTVSTLCGYILTAAAAVLGTSALPVKNTLADGPGGTDPNKPRQPPTV